MAVSFDAILGSALFVFNNRITDPYTGTRTGSFFFDGDHTIVFNKFMPKGQVTEDTLLIDGHGFGKPFQRDEAYRINAHFFNKKGDTDKNNSGFKDRALAMHYMGLMKDAVISNLGSFGNVQIEFDTIERPIYLEDQRVFVSTLPIIFKTRTC